MAVPIREQAGFREDRDPNHPLTKALRGLVNKHELHGAVLLTFTGGDMRVGTNWSASSDEFGMVLDKLSLTLLEQITNGAFDHALEKTP